MSSRRRRAALVLLAGGVPLALLVTAILVPALVWTRIPARVADHWGIVGAPNGSNPKIAAFGIGLGIAVVGSGILAVWGKRAWSTAGGTTVASVRRGRGSRLLVSGLAMTCLGASISVDLTLVNLGVPRWQDTRQPVPAIVVLAVGPVALGAAGAALARHLGLGWTSGAHDEAVSVHLDLKQSERALWLSRSSNGWALFLAITGLGAGTVVGFASKLEPALVIVVVSLAVLSLSSVSVSASAAGIVVRYGPLRWPSTRIALHRIVNAEAVQFTPKGWGYRGSLALVGTAAVIVKKGAALSLSLAGGKTFLVTVDDAVTGAALLNEELARVSHEEG